MPKLTPEEVTQKQANRLKGATEDIRKGIERVTVSPTSQAAAKIGKMRANLLAKIDDGTVEKRLKAVSLDQWKQRAATTGVNRISEGIDNAHDKQVEFYGKLLPAQDAIKAKIAQMPDLTLEDNINRMTTFIRDMSKFRK
tara:strand:+ start:161 stop:580 length:420 start_codon:yes stop_codon:yes gene_type:complete